jgi:hypothetical protein
MWQNSTKKVVKVRLKIKALNSEFNKVKVTLLEMWQNSANKSFNIDFKKIFHLNILSATYLIVPKYYQLLVHVCS